MLKEDVSNASMDHLKLSSISWVAQLDRKEKMDVKVSKEI